jgi:hypothetical protein
VALHDPHKIPSLALVDLRLLVKLNLAAALLQIPIRSDHRRNGKLAGLEVGVRKLDLLVKIVPPFKIVIERRQEKHTFDPRLAIFQDGKDTPRLAILQASIDRETDMNVDDGALKLTGHINRTGCFLRRTERSNGRASERLQANGNRLSVVGQVVVK